MRVVGIQLKSNEAIIVVIDQDDFGNIIQMEDSIKLKIENHLKSEEITQFRDQIFTLFDNLKPNKLGVIARNPKGAGVHAPSAISFKLEGIIQLYGKIEVQFIWPVSIESFLKKQPNPISPKNKYQQSALNLAFYLVNNG